MTHNPLVLALLGTGFTFLATALGAASVFLFKKGISPRTNKTFLGFAAGVMIAASVWSLLIPALEDEAFGGWLPAVVGFLAGGGFLYLLDRLLPHLHPGASSPEGLPARLGRTTMLVLAVTLHNIPEGLAVGLSFALAAEGGTSVTMASAVMLSIGMALQNLPEGAAISLPLYNEGMSKKRAFVFGAMSGAVEPVAGLLGVVMALVLARFMPYFLSFAAGAMIYVVLEELVPEANDEHSHFGTWGAMAGFALMMVLDVALG